jgi:ubiquinone/menaquinone biosynthesis C-methylase UbiE
MRRLWWASLRLAFHLFYNQFAWTYDCVARMVSFGQWQAWGQKALLHLRGRRILELAHGPGHLLVALAERGLSPVGIDLSSAMGRMARRRLRKAGMDVPLVRARAQALPFRDGYFDSVVATFPTEFILARATLHEVARVLGKDGRLVVVAGTRLGSSDPLARFVRWLYRITGQGEPLPRGSESVLREAKFASRVVEETIGHNQVVLVVAEKRSAGGIDQAE